MKGIFAAIKSRFAFDFACSNFSFKSGDFTFGEQIQLYFESFRTSRKLLFFLYIFRLRKTILSRLDFIAKKGGTCSRPLKF